MRTKTKNELIHLKLLNDMDAKVITACDLHIVVVNSPLQILNKQHRS
jgi:hypothetical protein